MQVAIYKLCYTSPNRREMKRITPSKQQTSAGKGFAGFLSPEHEKQSVELALLRRILRRTKAASGTVLKEARLFKSEVQLAQEKARMEHPGFVELAKRLEKSVPVTSGFGRFDDKE